MEILIIVCLAVLVSVFIVKFCIKGEYKETEKDSGLLHYEVEIKDSTEEIKRNPETSHYEEIKHEEKDIKDEKKDIRETRVSVKSGIVYGTKSASVKPPSQKVKEVKTIYQYIPTDCGWKCSYCDCINDDSEKRCQVCGIER